MINTDLTAAPLYFAGDIKAKEFVNALSLGAPFSVKGIVYRAAAPLYDLTEYIRLAKERDLALLIDYSSVKGEDVSSICGALFNAAFPLKFISSEKSAQASLKKTFPRAEFLLKSEFFDVTLVPDLLINGFAADIYYDKLTFERIRDLHALNIPTFCHGVKDADVAALLTYYNVDGIIVESARVFKV